MVHPTEFESVTSAFGVGELDPIPTLTNAISRQLIWDPLWEPAQIIEKISIKSIASGGQGVRIRNSISYCIFAI
jgi:hypothetical protein